MDGVIILNIAEKIRYTGLKWYFAGQAWSWVGIILTAICIAITCLLLWYGFHEYEDLAIGLGIFCLLIGITILLFTLGHNKYEPYIEYKVTITENTNMKEFYDKYEIQGQEGLIFTVVEKEPINNG